MEKARQLVIAKLEESSYLPENTCIHGFTVCIKKRNLKRRTTILKHSRFLQNLEVFPIFPPEPEPVVLADDINDDDDNNDDDN